MIMRIIEGIRAQAGKEYISNKNFDNNYGSLEIVQRRSKRVLRNSQEMLVIESEIIQYFDINQGI